MARRPLFPPSLPTRVRYPRLLPAFLATALGLLAAASARAVTLLPQEQAIANDMISDPGQGRPELILDPIIEAVARARAADMAARNYFSHVTPDGVAANYLLRRAGYELPAWWGTDPTANYVESIAAGYSNPADAWTAWMNSPEHKVHILGQNSFFASETHYGVGYCYDPNSTYKYYWVIITAPPQALGVDDPTPSELVHSGTIPVAGTTDPSSNAASVQFRVENASGAGAYQTASGVADWSGVAAGLVSGTNLIRFQSLDASGSLVNEVTRNIRFVPQGTLTVTVSGSGLVTHTYAGETRQDLGASITVEAVPARGSIFAGWTGSATSGSAVLRFTMQDGLAFQANFVPNPFPAAAGAYFGMVTSGSAQAGVLRFTLSATGRFSGRLLIAGMACSFVGQLDATGNATVTIPRPGLPPLVITISADLTGGTATGTVSDGTDTSTFSLAESSFHALTAAAPQAGRYTVALGPDPSATGSSVPQGTGYALLTVSKSGAAALSGRLADGTAFTASGSVRNDGTLAVGAMPLGAPAGSSLYGLLTFQSTAQGDVDGPIAWTRAPRASSALYPAGFSVTLQAVGSAFSHPAPGLQPMDLPPGTATAQLGGGALPKPMHVPMVLTQAAQVTMATKGAPDLTLSMSTASGLVTGSFRLRSGSPLSEIRGVVLQKQHAAFGYFTGAGGPGGFALTTGT